VAEVSLGALTRVEQDRLVPEPQQRRVVRTLPGRGLAGGAEDDELELRHVATSSGADGSGGAMPRPAPSHAEGESEAVCPEGGLGVPLGPTCGVVGTGELSSRGTAGGASGRA